MASAATWHEHARAHIASLTAEGKPVGSWNQALTVQLFQAEAEQLLKNPNVQ